ncbi:hypothetical protein FKM82_009440 [Ascaphus truei]
MSATFGVLWILFLCMVVYSPMPRLHTCYINLHDTKVEQFFFFLNQCTMPCKTPVRNGLRHLATTKIDTGAAAITCDHRLPRHHHLRCSRNQAQHPGHLSFSTAGSHAMSYTSEVPDL